MRKPPTSIAITGASAGLGSELAKAYAAPGIRLFLIGRSEPRLMNIADQCRQAGATADIMVTEVNDSRRLVEGFQAWASTGAIDLAIVNAGIFDGNGPDGQMEDMATIERQIATNLTGLAATVNAVLPSMRQRHSGTIALVGSLAALQPLADAPAYSASKAGAMAYGEALREYLMPEGVNVSLIYPGHIATAQVEHHVGALPGLMSAQKAAGIIKRGLDRGRSFIAFPWQLLWLIRLGRMVPWRVRALFGRGFRFVVAK